MTFTDDQLRAACAREYAHLCHDDFDPEEDMTEEEYAVHLDTLDRRGLLHEADVNPYYTLEQFMEAWG